MRKTVLVGALVLGGAIASVAYLSGDSEEHSTAESARAADERSDVRPVGAQADSMKHGGAVAPSVRTASNLAPSDPRIAALGVSPDNDLIEFVAGADGKVIAEIDNDPGSPGFKKPLREYMYSGDKVIGLTAYRYLGDHTQIVKTAVSYKPDGSIDQYLESTSYDYEDASTH